MPDCLGTPRSQQAQVWSLRTRTPSASRPTPRRSGCSRRPGWSMSVPSPANCIGGQSEASGPKASTSSGHKYARLKQKPHISGTLFCMRNGVSDSSSLDFYGIQPKGRSNSPGFRRPRQIQDHFRKSGGPQGGNLRGQGGLPPEVLLRYSHARNEASIPFKWWFTGCLPALRDTIEPFHSMCRAGQKSDLEGLPPGIHALVPL